MNEKASSNSNSTREEPTMDMEGTNLLDILQNKDHRNISLPNIDLQNLDLQNLNHDSIAPGVDNMRIESFSIFLKSQQ